MRVKLWDASGRVVYSDEPRLIGLRYPLDPAKRRRCEPGRPAPSSATSRGRRTASSAVRATCTRSTSPCGRPTARCSCSRRTSAEARSPRPSGGSGSARRAPARQPRAALARPGAARVAARRRLQRTQEDRAALLERAVEASADERRRIAADLHDGPVQDLAGISYSLSAAAEAEGSPATRGDPARRGGSDAGVLRRLRTLLVEIHPPNLRATGWRPPSTTSSPRSGRAGSRRSSRSSPTRG